jgi:hypothetical protein
MIPLHLDCSLVHVLISTLHLTSRAACAGAGLSKVVLVATAGNLQHSWPLPNTGASCTHSERIIPSLPWQRNLWSGKHNTLGVQGLRILL